MTDYILTKRVIGLQDGATITFTSRNTVENVSAAIVNGKVEVVIPESASDILTEGGGTGTYQTIIGVLKQTSQNLNNGVWRGATVPDPSLPAIPPVVPNPPYSYTSSPGRPAIPLTFERGILLPGGTCSWYLYLTSYQLPIE